MANYFAEFDSTPSTLVADLKSRILNSSNWANISGGTGNVMQATTARGAQMNIDLADAAATARQLQVGVYRLYSSGSGTDKLVRYICWHLTGGATSDPIHVALSAGQDHLYIAIEGPRAGEPNTDDATSGSERQCLFLGDLVPYFTAEPNPVVVLLANATSLSQMDISTVYVSRNRANSASWLPAKLGTLFCPNTGTGTSTTPWSGLQRACSADSNTYLFPYVVFEDTAGIRGRLGKVFFAGFIAPGLATSVTDFPPPLYQRLVYNSENYVLVVPHKGTAATWRSRSAFGWQDNGSSQALAGTSPVIAVPTA